MWVPVQNAQAQFFTQFFVQTKIVSPSQIQVHKRFVLDHKNCFLKLNPLKLLLEIQVNKYKYSLFCGLVTYEMGRMHSTPS